MDVDENVAEVLDAFSDCNPISDGERDMNFLSEEMAARKAGMVLTSALPGGHNEMKPWVVRRQLCRLAWDHSRVDLRVRICRERSPGVYVRDARRFRPDELKARLNMTRLRPSEAGTDRKKCHHYLRLWWD